jgi:hypothetical protein
LKIWGQLRTVSLCYSPFDTEVLHVVLSKTDDCKIKILLGQLKILQPTPKVRVLHLCILGSFNI